MSKRMIQGIIDTCIEDFDSRHEDDKNVIPNPCAESWTSLDEEHFPNGKLPEDGFPLFATKETQLNWDAGEEPYMRPNSGSTDNIRTRYAREYEVMYDAVGYLRAAGEITPPPEQEPAPRENSLSPGLWPPLYTMGSKPRPATAWESLSWNYDEERAATPPTEIFPDNEWRSKDYRKAYERGRKQQHRSVSDGVVSPRTILLAQSISSPQRVSPSWEGTRGNDNHDGDTGNDATRGGQGQEQEQEQDNSERPVANEEEKRAGLSLETNRSPPTPLYSILGDPEAPTNSQSSRSRIENPTTDGERGEGHEAAAQPVALNDGSDDDAQMPETNEQPRPQKRNVKGKTGRRAKSRKAKKAGLKAQKQPKPAEATDPIDPQVSGTRSEPSHPPVGDHAGNDPDGESEVAAVVQGTKETKKPKKRKMREALNLGDPNVDVSGPQRETRARKKARLEG